MKRHLLIITLSCIAILAIDLLLFRSSYNEQINQQKNLLFRETEVCTQEIESVITKFESDLNYILFTDDISNLFIEDDSDELRKIQFFYSAYNSLIKNIDIYDNEKNVLNVFRDKKQNFITDRYIGQRQRKLLVQDEVIMNKTQYQYVLPVFKNNKIYANILVTINLKDYILSVLEKFHLEDYTWQWVADIDNVKIYNTQGISLESSEGSEEVLRNLAEEQEGLLVHNIKLDSLEYRLLTVYSPIKVLNKSFGIAMSINYEIFLNNIFSKLIIITVISILIFIFVSVYLYMNIRTLKKKIKS